MTETKHTQFKKRAVALAVASCLSFAPLIAQAAGLGKLTVLSGLGQPLRAELDIGATKDELAGMSARLAPQDAFRQAGVDFASVLLDLRFAVEKRPNGQAVIKVSSFKPINEPFLDFLVELNWPAGRLVREYTFLLDPPEIAAKQTSRPVAEARIVETVRGGGAVEERTAPVRAAPRQAPAPRVAAEPKPKAEGGNTRVVQSGDTLRKIADETRHDGVTLEQMLVGLFQSNQDAFIAQNVNRLKAGAILNIPEKAAVESVSPAEARKIYVAQTSDWNNYRQKLAGATAKTPARADEGGAQSSSGKITAKVEEKAAPAEQGKDQLKVARTDAAAKGAAAAKAAETAEQVARDKALKDAQERMAVLEKNVGELQKLLEMKNQKLAELQQPPKKEEPKPVEPPKPAPKLEAPPKPVEAPKPVEPPKVAEEQKPVEAPKPVEAKPAEVKPAEAPKPVEQPKAVMPPVPAPAPVEEPGIVDSLMEDPLPLVGGGGVLALLAAYFVARRRRTQGSSIETTAAPMPSSLGPNSVFRMTGGQSVDTGNTPPQTGDFSQTGPGTIDTDEVDPVAEADVYMAYGRDTQAEEILLEALQKDPQRTAIHAKLLEIYANRRSLKQFETLASELYAQTAGVGPDWEKVALLGAALDPGNPLYGGSPSLAGADSLLSEPGAAPEIPSLPESFGAEPVIEAVAPVEVALEVPAEEPSTALPEIGFADGVERETMVIPKEPTEPPQVSEPAADSLADDVDGMTLDFDLGEATVAPDLSEPKEAPADDVAFQGGDALDFDLAAEMGEPEPLRVVEPEPVPTAQDELPADSGAIDFDLNVPEEPLLEPSAAEAAAPDFSPEGTLVMPSASVSEDFDVGLGTWVGVEGQGVSVDTAEGPDAAVDPSLTRTVVNSLAGTDTFVGGEDLLNFGHESSPESLTSTVVNPGMVDSDALEFDVKLSESVFLGEPMTPPEFDIGSINLDLSAQPALAPAPEAPAAPVAEPAAPPVATAPVQDAQWEEVNTKLDLAKAYEEMGDLEGARELLQEVVGEGPVDLVEQAKAILARIAG